MSLIDELRAALVSYDDWPTPEGRGRVIHHARELVRAIDARAATIEHMRHHITPSEQAIGELLGEQAP